MKWLLTMVANVVAELVHLPRLTRFEPAQFPGWGTPWKYHVDENVNAFSHDSTQRIVDFRTRSLKKNGRKLVFRGIKNPGWSENLVENSDPPLALIVFHKNRQPKKAESRFVGWQINPAETCFYSA